MHLNREANWLDILYELKVFLSKLVGCQDTLQKAGELQRQRTACSASVRGTQQMKKGRLVPDRHVINFTLGLFGLTEDTFYRNIYNFSYKIII